MAKPCIVASCPGLAVKGPRCPTHETLHQQHRNATRTHYHGTWQTDSRAARQAWVDQHGLVCPGIGRHPHPVPDIGSLTLDHTTGTVACLRCNVAAGPAFRTRAS